MVKYMRRDKFVRYNPETALYEVFTWITNKHLASGKTEKQALEKARIEESRIAVGRIPVR
jgi:hypothetical protein